MVIIILHTNMYMFRFRSFWDDGFQIKDLTLNTLDQNEQTCKALSSTHRTAKTSSEFIILLYSVFIYSEKKRVCEHTEQDWLEMAAYRIAANTTNWHQPTTQKYTQYFNGFIYVYIMYILYIYIVIIIIILGNIYRYGHKKTSKITQRAWMEQLLSRSTTLSYCHHW